MNKKKSLILLTLSGVLITTAIAQVSSGDNYMVTRRSEVTAPKVEAARQERLGEPVFPPDQHVRREYLSSQLPGAFLALGDGLERPGTSAGQNESQESIEVEVVMATADGFEPAVVTRPPGPFVLAVHNRSGAGELVLRLVRAQDGQRYEARLLPGKRSHRQKLDLPPGEYILSEASHPAWRCQILLTR